MEMRQELEALVSKYGSGADLAKELKKLQGGDSTKRARLEAALDKVIADYGTITLPRFKKEATKAWHRAFPEGVQKRELKGYQLFVKENMPRVKEENPDKTHTERMVIIGKMWQDSKGVPPAAPAAAAATTDVDPDTERATETEDNTVTPNDGEEEDAYVPRNNKRGKRTGDLPPAPPVTKRRTRRG